MMSRVYFIPEREKRELERNRRNKIGKILINVKFEWWIHSSHIIHFRVCLKTFKIMSTIFLSTPKVTHMTIVPQHTLTDWINPLALPTTNISSKTISRYNCTHSKLFNSHPLISLSLTLLFTICGPYNNYRIESFLWLSLPNGFSLHSNERKFYEGL